MALCKSCHPDCVRAKNEQEDYDASQSAALVAVSLISSARVILKIDTEYTQYSAQYLVDRARRSKKKNGQPGDLTVKDALAFALKKGLPKAELWAHLGCILEPPAAACHIHRVPMKGKVVEGKTLDDAHKMLLRQLVGARLHVFSPEIDLVGDGIYQGQSPASGNQSRYVGLRDVIIVAVKKGEKDRIMTVKMCYKKKTSYVDVSMSEMFLPIPHNGDHSQSQAIGPSLLLVDFCVPRFK